MLGIPEVAEAIKKLISDLRAGIVTIEIKLIDHAPKEHAERKENKIETT